MNTLTSDNEVLDITGDIFPFYKNETVPPVPKRAEEVANFNADLVSNYKLSRATAPSPNTIVPVGADGKLPIEIIPVLAGTSAVIGASNTYANLKASPLAGLYFAWATDIGQGALVFNTAAAGIGDSGWLVIAGG